jgi:hypothetical protein
MVKADKVSFAKRQCAKNLAIKKLKFLLNIGEI